MKSTCLPSWTHFILTGLCCVLAASLVAQRVKHVILSKVVPCPFPSYYSRKKKKCKKAKWLSEEAFQIAVKRIEAKNKGEKEIYTHLNAEFQRIARRDKKAFLSDQCKEIEENNRDLFKKIRDPKGTFHANMGSIKDRNVMNLTEAEDIKKKLEEYTEELYKKDLHNPDNHDGVITHLEPDILECEVKWALGSITMNKASGAAGIPVELFQILKDDAVKVLHSICQQIWKTEVATGLEEVSFHSNPKGR